MSRKHCPECGRFMEQVRKESLAKLDGERVWFTRHGDRCACGYRQMERYAEACKLRGLEGFCIVTGGVKGGEG